MVGDLCEKRHHFNGLLARRVWIPSAASQIFSRAVGATQNGHGQNEVNMKTCQSYFLVWWLLVEHEQSVELVC
jgi:hypothetical protein